MTRGFSFVEAMISMSVLVVLLSGIYMLLGTGSLTYSLEAGLIELQQDMRGAMDTITRELRQASVGNISSIDDYPNNVTFNTNNETGIRYYHDAVNNRLVRADASGATRIIGNSISDITFDQSSRLINVQLTGEKPVTTFAGVRNITSILEEKVTLRND